MLAFVCCESSALGSREVPRSEDEGPASIGPFLFSFIRRSTRRVAPSLHVLSLSSFSPKPLGASEEDELIQRWVPFFNQLVRWPVRWLSRLACSLSAFLPFSRTNQRRGRRRGRGGRDQRETRRGGGRRKEEEKSKVVRVVRGW